MKRDEPRVPYIPYLCQKVAFVIRNSRFTPTFLKIMIKQHIGIEYVRAMNMPKTKYEGYYFASPLPSESRPPQNKKVVIFNLAAKHTSLGLSDILRGAVFTYSIARERGVEFRINFVCPFNLNLFFLPNSYNWEIDEKDVSYNLNDSDLINLVGYDFRVSYKYIKKYLLCSPNKQLHIYTNAFLVDKKEHSQRFNELFKPNARLQKELDLHRDSIGATYISATFRFQNRLGDFEELNIKPIQKEEQRSLIERCKEQLVTLHQRYPNKRILVTSDSITFLKHVNDFDFTYIIDGRPIHMSKTNDDSFETHKKAFLDYLMIANAEKIFSFYTEYMYSSGFPISASWINNRPYKLIKF